MRRCIPWPRARAACRDFAVLMMEAARSLGFAARFVSGYLYDEALVDSVDPMVGGGSTHAWCAIYLPGAGWVEYDPTNGLIAGRNLIRVSMAREPHQATPLSGGYIGRPEDFKTMAVSVEVTVGDPPGPEEQARRKAQKSGRCGGGRGRAGSEGDRRQGGRRGLPGHRIIA